MWLRAFALALFSVFALPPSGTVQAAADAPATEWKVFQAVGDVLVRGEGNASAWRLATRGETFDGTFSVETGADGQATLTHGDDVIHVSPNSQMELEPPARGGVVTQVVQSLGNLFFGVETRPDRNFKVETPYLVTLVKGTTFSVSVSEDGAAVAVAEGTVAVFASEGNDSQDITTGRTAHVSATDRSTVSVGQVSSRGYAQPPANAKGKGKGGVTP